MLTVNDGTGLPNETNARSIWVEVAEAPKVEISGVDICVGNAVAFSLANLPADTDQSRLTWSFGDGTSGTGGNITHAFSRAGNLCGRRRRAARSGRQRGAYAGDQGRRRQPAAGRAHRSRRKTCPGATVSFDASGSFDPDGTIAGYAWDFGDGETRAGRQDRHVSPSRAPIPSR